jgi:hypothetical protein
MISAIATARAFLIPDTLGREYMSDSGKKLPFCGGSIGKAPLYVNGILPQDVGVMWRAKVFIRTK